MGWFKRTKNGVTTPTQEKKDTPDGIWYKTPSGVILDKLELEENNFVSPVDNYHLRIDPKLPRQKLPQTCPQEKILLQQELELSFVKCKPAVKMLNR